MKNSFVLCDTNILIHLFLNDSNTIAELSKIGSENILISSVTEMELLKGAGDKKELLEMKKKIVNYAILHFNEKVSGISVELVQNYHLSHGLKIPDAIIAASSIAFELPLFTYNLKDFKYIPDINLYKP
ncbi:MAG: type II toxin-antitoxin system VapC family toxin [Bacteroidia bacterium]|nr:type II toxin-antitoxin system VapC family toxin [Bacteroidia bacterium]